MIHLPLSGGINKIIITFHTNKLMENDEILIMDSLLFLIVEVFNLMNMIVAHTRQCQKSNYVISIHSDLLLHKIFIYNY